MSIHALPVTRQRQHDIRVALEITDTAINELLRLAVASYSGAGLHVVNSARRTVPNLRVVTENPLDRESNLAAGNAYLQSVEVILDKPGLGEYLQELLSDSVHDVRHLAAISHSFDGFDDGPSAA